MVKKIRPAIAMIELIFAITIMGIVLMSAPRLMQVAVNSGYVATQQESIAEAATKVNMLLGYSWDERIADDSNMSTILTVTAGDTSLNNTPNMRRMGTPPISYRAFVDTNGTTLPASAIALDAGELVENDFDDIDDFNGTVTNLTDLTAGGADVDYIDKNITLTTAISYSDDNVSGTGYQKIVSPTPHLVQLLPGQQLTLKVSQSR